MTTQARSEAVDAKRLEALIRYDILDTPPESTFDRITRTAAAFFDVPVSIITFVDRHRSWFKSYLGVEITEIERSSTMCDTVIRGDEVLVISDAQCAPRPLVDPLLKLGMRFYAGAPLRTYDGIKLGTLCVLDMEPRQVTTKEAQVLADLAATVMDLMELRSAIRKLGETEDTLRGLNNRLEAASRNKSEFLADMSHELRTPLNAILGASELLGDGLFGKLNEKQEEYARYIHESGAHLLSLIDDVLDLSKIEAGKIDLHLAHLDVATTMEGCAAAIRGSAAAKSLEFTVVPPPEPVLFEGDERRIRQIAYNLLCNAVKFTPEGGTVTFKAWPKGGEVAFAVEDSGPGIPAAFHERVFEQFFRIPGDQEGTGLGLALARRLVELHRGRVWLESEVGLGSRFYFAIPAAQAG